MNKISTVAIHMISIASLLGTSYYAGLPKSKKENLKAKAKEMLRQDKNIMNELY